MRLTGMLGTSNQKDITEALGAGSKGFPTDLFLYYNLNAGSIPTVSDTSNKTETKLTSLFRKA